MHLPAGRHREAPRRIDKQYSELRDQRQKFMIDEKDKEAEGVEKQLEQLEREEPRVKELQAGPGAGHRRVRHLLGARRGSPQGCRRAARAIRSFSFCMMLITSALRSLRKQCEISMINGSILVWVSMDGQTPECVPMIRMVRL